METVTKRNRFDGNSFDGYAPCSRTCRQRRPIFGANPRRAVVVEVMTKCHRLEHFREVTKLIELVTFCYRLGFLPAVERLLVVLLFPLSHLLERFPSVQISGFPCSVRFRLSSFGAGRLAFLAFRLSRCC